MSSESEDEENESPSFTVYMPSWRSEKLTKVYRAMESSMVKNMSRVARNQYLPRYVGGEKVCDPPNIPEEFGWIVKS